MPAEAVATPSANDQTARLAIVVPLAVERQCLRAAQRSYSDAAITIIQCGQGAENAARAARDAISNGATALMSVGVAGGLAEKVSAGDVVIADSVIDAISGDSLLCSRSWSSALRNCAAETGAVHVGTLLSVPAVLATQDQKSRAASQHDAIACDMESAAIAVAARAANAHFATLRVISDGYRDELPGDVSEWVDDSGNPRMRSVLKTLLSPARWRSFALMTKRFRIAQRRLRQLSRSMSAAAYYCPQT